MKPSLPQPCYRTPSEMPALEKLVSPGGSERSTAPAIHRLLRQTALQNRNNHLQRFYSIRSVAKRFHVPPATVSRIYRQLSSEKLIRMIWGSRTLLEPAKSLNSECRCVGIAVNLRRFVGSPDYRLSIITLQTELWNHAVSEHLLFFEIQPDEVVQICTRNHHPDIDAVVWPSADPLDKHALLRLHDLGIRLVCWSDHPIPGVSECYTVSPRCTIRMIVRQKVLKI